MIGFKNSLGNHDPGTLHCPIHIGTPLIKDPKDKESSVLICPECGLPYQETELTHETGPMSKQKAMEKLTKSIGNLQSIQWGGWG
jgi:hypothetical protein